MWTPWSGTTRLLDLSVPMELLPDKIYNEFNTGDATHDGRVLRQRHLRGRDHGRDPARSAPSRGKQCFVSGMSALVTDLKDLCEQEEPIYVGIAVVLACAAMMIFLDGWLVPFVFLACIGIDDPAEPGHQLLLRRDFLHHQGAGRRASAGRHDGLLHLPVAQLQRAAANSTADHKEAMAVAIQRHADQRRGQFHHDRSPALRRCAS